jgi:hypothetical protein
MINITQIESVHFLPRFSEFDLLQFDLHHLVEPEHTFLLMCINLSAELNFSV